MWVSSALVSASSWWQRCASEVTATVTASAGVQGISDDLLAEILADGYALAPRELAGLVHVESVKLADQIRRICINRKENVAIEGTGGITQPGMTQLVGRLEREGLVVRLIDPDDRLATLVDITDARQALRAQLRQTQRDNLAELLEALSPDDEATLSLAMRVAALLLDKLGNVAANKPPPNVSAPRQASVRAW
jgi:DNA-binding MarR family transcriptional regulator